MREIPKVTERKVPGVPTTVVTNELARAIQGMAPEFGNGQHVPPMIGAFLEVWLVWDSGPDAEVDKTNHQYWLRRAHLSNSGDTDTDKPEFKPVDSDLKYPDWILATNLAERPPKIDGTETNGGHSLPKGTTVGPVWTETDADGIDRWVFRATVGMVRLKIDSNRTRGGAYKAYIWRAPTTLAISFDSAGAITTANFGVQGEEVIAINMAEVGQNTHDLTAGTPKVLFAWGVKSPITSSTDSLPVYEVWMLDWKAC